MSASAVGSERSWLGRRLRSIRWHLRTPADAWLAARMVFWRIVLPVLKRALPLETLARHMRGRFRPRHEEEQVIRLASWVYGPRPLTGGDNCLERSLLLYRYLSAANSDARLVLGFRNGVQAIEGHAWLAIGERTMAATDDGGGFAPLVSFGRDGRVVEGTRSVD